MPITKFVKSYDRIVKKYPLPVNSSMGFIIAYFGDLLCQQYFSDETPKIDSHRSCKMGCIRALVIAPFIHFYYPWLVRIYPGKEKKHIFVRVVLGELILSTLNLQLMQKH